MPCKCFHFCGGQNREMGWEANTTWHFVAQLSREWQNLLKGCCGINILLPATNRISKSWSQLIAWAWMNVLLWHLGWSQSLSPYSYDSRGFGLCLKLGYWPAKEPWQLGVPQKCPCHGVWTQPYWLKKDLVICVRLSGRLALLLDIHHVHLTGQLAFQAS